MTECIIMTAAQAAVLTPSQDSPTTALVPILLADGVTYVLPVAVLVDPAHAQWHAFLSALPTRDVTPEEFAQGAPP